MVTSHDPDGAPPAPPTPTRRRLVATVLAAALLTGGAPAIAEVPADTCVNSDRDESSCHLLSGRPDGWFVEPAAADDGDAEQSRPRSTSSLAATPSRGDGQVSPDRVADVVGGIAARVHTASGTPVPGNVFLLMARAGSDAKARAYDRTSYTHTSDQIHTDTIQSNVAAVLAVEAITGDEVPKLDFTTAPAGGSSGGITYAIAYLNIVSDGAFTGHIAVAATGRLEPRGYVHPINTIDEKTTAAHLAGADVLFTSSMPTAELVDTYGYRAVGELFRSRQTGAPLADERLWGNYRAWGLNRSEDEMDIVGIRHIGDVVAYLCGAGSDYACEILDLLGDVAIDRSTMQGDGFAVADDADGVAHHGVVARFR